MTAPAGSVPRIVIMGGGFAGVAVAQALEHVLPREAASLHLVSRDNFFLFHPMLPEAAGSSIEADHIVSPLRQLCPHTMVTVGQATEIDLQRKTVVVAHGAHEAETPIPYDFLVLALGAVTNFSEVRGMAQHALGLKTVGDALYIRNHVINMLEEADIETDPELRRELLTFVVAGGGFSGVEAVAEINDYVREASQFYRRVDRREIRVVLLHAGDRILPELSAGLAGFAADHLRRHGVEIRLRTRLEGATECDALLGGGETIPTRTLVVTIGTATNPLIATLPVTKDERGRIVVTPHLEVAGYPGVWALGDGAAVPNATTGQLAPPTAQFAQREGKLVARNIAAAIQGGPQGTFSYRGMGQFVSLGHRTAVAEILGFKVSGFIAWFLWRTVYLSKLPSLSRKARVAGDWTIDLLFGRDIAQLPMARGERLGRAHYEPGDVIVHQGDVGDLFYVVTDGEVEVVREGTDSTDAVIARMGPGECFGEAALLRSTARNATVRAATAVNVLTLGRDDFTVLARSWASLRDAIQAASQART